MFCNFIFFAVSCLFGELKCKDNNKYNTNYEKFDKNIPSVALNGKNNAKRVCCHFGREMAAWLKPDFGTRCKEIKASFFFFFLIYSYFCGETANIDFRVASHAPL